MCPRCGRCSLDDSPRECHGSSSRQRAHSGGRANAGETRRRGACRHAGGEAVRGRRRRAKRQVRRLGVARQRSRGGRRRGAGGFADLAARRPAGHLQQRQRRVSFASSLAMHQAGCRSELPLNGWNMDDVPDADSRCSHGRDRGRGLDSGRYCTCNSCRRLSDCRRRPCWVVTPRSDRDKYVAAPVVEVYSIDGSARLRT